MRRTLHVLRPSYEGRGAALTEHGLYLLTHLVFRSLDTEPIDEPDPKQEWAAAAVAEVPQLVRALLPEVVAAIDELFTDRSRIQAVCADVVRCRALVDYVLSPTADRSGEKLEQDKYRRRPMQRKTRRPNAVHVLVDKGVLEEGAPLTLTMAYPLEAEALRDWLSENQKRSLATWVNHRSKPILWAADGKQYSPSGLITHMWELAEWERRPVANQGTARWVTAAGETLADLAWRVLGELEESVEDDVSTGPSSG
ncbi:hypothetical protein [Streptomyces luteolus]|uniref:Uncharacterized protein n=1 Tax=Streptomyces luteolus TaxID=3043615 RepID=A0ABT6SUC4_9ACTN|nr:hypothetical protein [Streptomyces sp. B-S-A12]MDI3418688.1 hypothetical protein [Streptomyces sp. B-S-A12]